jgi:hypothetical protein
MRPALLVLTSALALAACNSQPASTPKEKTATKGKAGGAPSAALAGNGQGTAMAERVAVIGLLNKRNGQTRDFELKPGQSVRLGKVALFVRACERTAPWETYPDEGAFVRMAVFERPPGTNDSERWRWVFSGWLFKENPAANILQHPVYDVWVKACKMSFPGEEPAPGDLSAPDDDNKPSNSPQSPSKPKVDAAPAPAPEPEEEEPADGEGEATIET